MQPREPDAEAKPLDPIALSLALVVAGLGVEKLAEQAAVTAQYAADANGKKGGAAAQPSPAQAYLAWGG
jgi:hypothetical protein